MKKINKKKILILLLVIALIVGIIISITKKNTQISLNNYDDELLRSMSYAQFVEGDENVEGTDNVKFSSFFLRDLDGDGYAEKLKGTCKEVGSQDTLYMEIIVQTEGHLDNAKIQVDGKNFYLATALPKDNELKENYIGANVKTIEFEQLNNGTQKLLTGFVRSGDYTRDSSKYNAIGNNINNYSKEDNKIILTGIYVKEDGTEIPITKEIELTADWYGKTTASFKYLNNQNYYDIDNRINENDENIRLNFNIYTEETKKELNLKSNYLEGTIPQLNGYNPISVKQTNNNGTFTYDEGTRKFSITRNAITDENGNITTSVSRNQTYPIEVIYPIDAYNSLGTESVTIKIPVTTYYEGYNNLNDEFSNPYKSNIASATIVTNYSKERGSVANLYIKVGKYVSSPNYHYMVSKKKPLRLYNEISSEETDDYYTVTWEAYTGSTGESSGITLTETKSGTTQKSDTFIKTNSSEESMEDITTNVGIYFSNADNILGTDGEIKVYNEETGELVYTFNSTEWNRYSSTNPYRYDTSIKHVKIVTSKTNINTSLYVFNIKELDDEKITTVYSKEEFYNLQYIKSNLSMYINGSYLGTKTNQALYEEPYSYATIGLSKNVLSTQVTEKNVEITIETITNEEEIQDRWVNGTFLVKLPDEILDVKVNDTLSNSVLVKDDSTEILENEKGKFIKVKTSNVNPASYTLTINCDITLDPRIASISKNIELYAINEDGTDYYNNSSDIYDVDSDGNLTEKVNKSSTSISLVAPNSLLTNQTISEYDNNGNIVVSPQIADLKPIYSENEHKKQTVRIGAQLKNNYSSTISEVIMVGKIPFEGNSYALSGSDLLSDFTTTMTNQGITVPEELDGKVTVYYSINENPTKDLSNDSNNWVTKDNVQDWSQIKSWLVDFGDTIIDTGDEYTFYYKVEIPFGVDLNKVAYSHHGIYFCLDTSEGKYRTQTEPNKIGIKIAEKYDLSLTKYQKNLDKKIQGATYRVSKLDDNGNIEESQTAKTNAEGLLRMTNLYAERVYEIKEIGTPIDYDLNENIIKIITHANMDTGNLTVEKLEGTIRGELEVTKSEGEDYKVAVKVEDEANAKLKILKYEQGTDTLLSGIRFSIKGEGLPDNGKNIRTNINGEANLSGLKIGKEYILEETKTAKGYYSKDDKVKFTINNNYGVYTLNISDGTTKANYIVNEDNIPILTIEIEDKKIPTYDLIINKIEKDSINDENPNGIPIIGAKFKLFKGDKELGTYLSDNEGHITINGLYQYEDDMAINQTYTLKETYAPDGYAKTNDRTFQAKINDVNNLILDIDENTQYEIQNKTVTLTIEDCKSFKLTKKDGETNELLPNTKFAIYNIDEGEIPARNSKGDILGTKEKINGREYYTLTTNSRGEITADLAEGLYKAVEIEADEKYNLENNNYYFGIGKSREGKTNLFEKDRNQISAGITSIKKTSDDGYIACGNFGSSTLKLGKFTLTNSSVGTQEDSYIVKYNKYFEVEWYEQIKGGQDDYAFDVLETSNGDIMVVGSADSIGGTYFGGRIRLSNHNANTRYSDGFVARFEVKDDNSGLNILWAKNIGEAYKDEGANTLQEINDHEVIVSVGFFNKKRWTRSAWRKDY